jgi:hypothetical protein
MGLLVEVSAARGQAAIKQCANRPAGWPLPRQSDPGKLRRSPTAAHGSSPSATRVVNQT